MTESDARNCPECNAYLTVTGITQKDDGYYITWKCPDPACGWWVEEKRRASASIWGTTDGQTTN